MFSFLKSAVLKKKKLPVEAMLKVHHRGYCPSSCGQSRFNESLVDEFKPASLPLAWFIRHQKVIDKVET